MSNQPAKPGRKVLVVSYEFDAAGSPQGLRWVRLTEGLALLGWQVDVLTSGVAHGSAPKTATDGASIHIHRFFPGVYHRLTRRRPSLSDPNNRAGMGNAASSTDQAPSARWRLNWKGRTDAFIQSASSWLLYPDLRRESMPFLRQAVQKLVRANKYDAAVLSHEPPYALEVQDILFQAGVPAAIDLGDPVLATYTPKRWRRRALSLERTVCRKARALVVTTSTTLARLEERHGQLPEHTMVIPQGHDGPLFHGDRTAPLPSEEMRLVYTGRFYSFRDPRPLFEAASCCPGVRLEVATPQLPGWLTGCIDSHQIHFSSLSHDEALDLQASASILVVIGNRQAEQTPGKLFEYLGTPAPILYISYTDDDPGARLVNELRRGLVVRNCALDIRAGIRHLQALHQQGRLHVDFDLSMDSVIEYSWLSLAKRYSALLYMISR